MGSAGNGTSAFNVRIAGSFQLVIAPLKIFAAVGPFKRSELSPLTLKAIPIGENVTGICHAGEPQRWFASLYSFSSSGESERAKSVRFSVNSRIAVPEPFGLYSTVWPEHASSKASMK